MQKTGLIVAVDVIPASTLKGAKANGKLDLFRASWVADYPDAQNYLSFFIVKILRLMVQIILILKVTLLMLGTHNLLQKLILKPRETLYTKMDSIVMQEAPIVPLYYDEVVRFTQNNVTGFRHKPYKYVRIKTG